MSAWQAGNNEMCNFLCETMMFQPDNKSIYQGCMALQERVPGASIGAAIFVQSQIECRPPDDKSLALANTVMRKCYFPADRHVTSWGV